MTQRNVELQLQALDVIERRHLNSTASSSIDDGDIDVASSSSVSIEKPIPEHEHEQGEEELDDVIEEEMKYVIAILINFLFRDSFETWIFCVLNKGNLWQVNWLIQPQWRRLMQWKHQL